MKNLFLLLISTVVFNISNAQTISPSQSDEFCPNVEYTFTASLTGTFKSIIGQGGCTVTQFPTVTSGTTITFKGKFSDVNQNQTFRIEYTNNGIPSIFDFKKIKSLFFGSSCTPIQLNQTNITSPPCQITNHTISFNNAQWETSFESPQLCFGTITTYEYLLPSGWKLNGNTSNGSTWMAGSNNVSVTSDLSTGGFIQVRAVNPCGSSLTKGQVSLISISRPKPLLNFTGGYAVCSSQDFQANNVPAWANNFNWLVTPNTVFENLNSTSNPTSVSKLANGEGYIQLTISSSSCPLSFVYNTEEITNKPKLVAGVPEVSNTNPPMLIYNGAGDENQVCRYQGTTFDLNYTANSSVNWSAISHQGGSWPSWSPTSDGDIYVEFFKGNQNTLILQVDASNTCGVTSYQFGFIAINCGGMRFSVSPNPVTSDIDVKSDDDKAPIKEIRIVDKNGNIIKRETCNSDTFSKTVNISLLPAGMYIVQIFDGKLWVSKQIFKQ